MSLIDLNVVNSAPEKGLFCEFFDNEEPLPPSGQPYYVLTQNTETNYQTPNGKFYVRSL